MTRCVVGCRDSEQNDRKMEKYTYREKRERVTQLFLRNVEDQELLLRSIDEIKDQSARIDKVARLLEKYIPYEIAMYHNHPWIFNGCYYEPITYEQLKYGIEDFLYDCKVLASDRNEKCLYHYMKRIEERIKEHELHPRLSLMCFTNCVVDMNTLKKYEFDPKHDVIKQYLFKYDRKAILSCKIWNAFLGENYLATDGNDDGVLPEKHKRKLLQMFLGACLVDRKIMSFEYFLILQGTGANGKSVIQKVLSGLFGDDEMLNIKLSQFARSGDEGLRAVASMEGKRLLHCTESSKSDFKDMSTIKAISSGEPLAGRAIGGNIRQYQRPPLLLCNSNYRWTMEDFVNRDDVADISVQRRAVIINFEKSIPVEKRDAMLAEKMKSEYAGIFAWIVKGLVDLKASGWRLPESVDGNVDKILHRMSATVTVRGGQKCDGSVVEWITRKTAYPEPSAEKKRVIKQRTGSELYYNYNLFCKDVGIKPVSLIKMGRDLVSMGFTKARTQESMYVLYVEDKLIADNFDTQIPNIYKSVNKADCFEAAEQTIEEFANSDGYGVEEAEG